MTTETSAATPEEARQALHQQIDTWLNEGRDTFAVAELKNVLSSLPRSRFWFFHQRDQLIDAGVIAESEAVGEYRILQSPFAVAETLPPAGGALPVTAKRRDDILSFAAALMPSGERDADAVTAVAEPLLAWAAGADDAADQRNRMRAMRNAHTNEPVVRHGKSLPTTDEFLAQARIYYRFISAGAPAGELVPVQLDEVWLDDIDKRALSVAGAILASLSRRGL